MVSRTFENSIVAVVGAATGAIVSAFLNSLLSKGNSISYWWIGALAGIFIAILLYLLYQHLARFPVGTWYVTNADDGTGLGSDGRILRKNGHTVCQFETNFDGWAVWGPATKSQEVVRKGRYKAVFRLKVNHKAGSNLPIMEISVSTRTDNGLGTKALAVRTLSNIDFEEDDKYQEFTLFFEVISEEREFELRIYSKNNSRTVSLNGVQVSKRLI